MLLLSGGRCFSGGGLNFDEVPMNCPRCGNPILALARSCSKCRLNYGEALYDKFEFYFGLKDELEKLTKLQNSLYGGIANVSVKIQKYEAVLRRDLVALPATRKKAPANQKTKTLSKASRKRKRR